MKESIKKVSNLLNILIEDILKLVIVFAYLKVLLSKVFSELMLLRKYGEELSWILRRKKS